MGEQPTQTMPPEQRLREILADYQAAKAAGQAPALEELLNRHPEFADQLRALFTLQNPSGSTQRSETLSVDPAATPPVSECEAPTLAPCGLAEEEPILCGRSFGDYELLGEIARGGMGIVYRARHKNLQRIVALKMILAGQLATPDQVRRFHIEAEQGGSLDHPNIVPIYQVGEQDRQHYFTMKLIEGGKLSEHIARLQQDPHAIAKLMATVARALHHAHQRGVLHRDLKPGNILVDAQGEPHVTDFGLAKHLGSKGADTQSGAIIGTPSYMAPEQAAGRKHLTVAADVYSLGAVLYELLTGRPPFQADSALDVVLQVLEKEPVRPSSLNLRVNRDLETIALMCLAKEPHRRYPSALALADDLERFLAGEPIRARPVGWVERSVKWVRRRPAVAALCAVIVLVVLGSTAFAWWHNVGLKRALRETEQARQLAQTNAQLVKSSFRKRLENVDSFLSRVDRRLANYTGLDLLRLEFLQEFLQLSEGLMHEDETDVSARRQTALIYQRIGDLNLQRRAFKDAEEPYHRALEIQQQLVADFPDSTDYQSELAQTQLQQARLLKTRQRFSEAQIACRKALALEDRLAETSGKPGDRARAARYRFELADLLEQAKQPEEAKRLYQETLEQQEKLVADNPKQASHHADLAKTADSLGVFLSATNPTEAQRYLERALAARRRARQVAPRVAAYARQLRANYADLDHFLKRQGEHATLARLAAEIRRDFPDNGVETYNAACIMADACRVAQQNSQLPEAERQRLSESYAQQAVALLDKASKEGYRDRAHMEMDHDLDPLRNRSDYQELLAQFDRLFPTRRLTPAEHYAALVKEYDNAESIYNALRRRAQTVAEKKRAEEYKPQLADFAQHFLRLAEQHRDSPSAVEALVWILEHSVSSGAKKVSPEVVTLREKAMVMLERDHFEKPEFANACQRLAETPSPDIDNLLRDALQKHAQQDVRGLAGYALALSLAKQAEEARPKNLPKADELSHKAEEQLEHIRKEYAAVAYGKSTLGEVAKEKLQELRSLSVGRIAPEIDGEDLNGERFKLSDYRGKIVVLDFWVNWCGFCRQMYPHERQLVERLKDEPFVLLGVNCDDDKAEVLRESKRQRLDWRSWWDGGSKGGHIAKEWQLHAYPLIYILDDKGVIRYKHEGFLRADELDEQVNKLLEERQAQTRLDKK